MERVELAGGHLEYQWAGSGDGRPTLVFLHEGLGCVAMWGRFPQALAAATRSRAVSYSRYGYGGSAPLPAPRTARFLHDEALLVLPDVLDRLGVRWPVLIGQSDGASIALIYAAHHPVAGLIVESPHVFAEPLTVAGVASIRHRFESDEGFRRKFGRYHRDAAMVIREWSEAWMAPAFGEWTIEEMLASISCPVLVLQAEHDPYGSLDHVRRIEARVRGPVRTVILPGVTHAPHRDCHARVLHEMAGFVSELALEG
jgi:pimeloyl-ACP methyl ester carboxylesterase